MTRKEMKAQDRQRRRVASGMRSIGFTRKYAAAVAGAHPENGMSAKRRRQFIRELVNR